MDMTTNDNLTVDQWLEAGRTLADGTKMSDERMAAVWELVNPAATYNAPSWKYPLHASVERKDATPEEVHKAVVWFAGGVPTITWTKGDGATGTRFHVSGAGYYEWIGA